MDLVTAGLRDDAVHVAGGDTGAGQDLNAAGGVLDHLTHGVGAQGHVGLLPTGEDAGDAQLDEHIQHFLPVGDHVDGPVEHGLLTGLLSQLGQDAGALLVQRTVLMEETEDQTVGAVGQELLGVLDGGGKLRIGVAEAALTGTDHGHDLHAGLPLGDDQLANGGSEAAVEEIAVELNPVGARLVGLAVGLTLGIIAAWKHNSGIDYFTMVIAVLGVSVPNFVVAALLQYYVGLQWGILPVAFWTNWACSVLPSIALSFSATAMFARFIRTEMLDVLEQDYITTARAKGLSQFKVLMVHAVRNSIIPVVTILGPVVVNLLTGSLAVESIYSVPGIGSLFVDCIKNNDYSTIMGITVFYSAFYIFVIMVVDILYSVIDPRIRIQGSKEG